MTTEELIEKYAFYILGNPEHIRRTIELVEATINLDGDYCELGTYIGGNCAIMGELCRSHNKWKKIYLYDSFDGIPYPTKEDTEIPGNPEGVERTGELKSTGVSVATLDWVHKVLGMSKYSNYIIMKGWLQESLPATAFIMTPLAFLRIDVDLYIPTKLGLEYFYDKVVKNGIVFVHDYNHLSGCQQAVDEFVEKHPEIKLNIDIIGGGVWWVK